MLRYSLQSAMKSLWREKWINILAVLSISIGLSLLCLFAIVSVNLDSLLHRWSKSFGIIAYLADDMSTTGAYALQNKFKTDQDIVNLKYISKEQALKDVRESLGDGAVILTAFKENPLPASFEMKLKEDLLDPAYVRSKADKIRQIDGIKEVQYGEKWLSSLYAVSKSIRIGSIIVGCLMFVAITFITYSTIKIFFYRRNEEIETLKLLGATKGFIRTPFLIEGFIIGALGGVISSLVIFGICSLSATKVVEFLPSLGHLVTTLPVLSYIVVTLSGAAVSVLGSFIAVGKIRY